MSSVFSDFACLIFCNFVCDSFTVAYYFVGKRQRRTFADLEPAKQEAELAATKICAGELDVLQLTSEDRTAYVRAMEMLKPLGTPLELAVMQFVEEAALLEGASRRGSCLPGRCRRLRPGGDYRRQC